jgi:Uma2 family endonuclease
VSQAARHHTFSYADYLERERETGLKHEWLDGEVFAMAGGSPEHARLIAAVTHALSTLVGAGRCRVYTAELKIRVTASGLATYPDVTVVCGLLQLDTVDPHAVVNPTVLVEVLSPSTEAYDRGEKWSHYRQIRSLQAYVLVDQFRPRIEVYERAGDEAFLHRVAGPGQRLDLACLGGALAVDDLHPAT